MKIPEKTTPLYNEHIALNARMVPFAGWLMPVQYEDGIIAEHLHTRNSVSLFDICHMGELTLKGENLMSELDEIFPRKVSSMLIGSCRYNFLLNKDATVIDDLIIYKIDENEVLLVVNAASKNEDYAFLCENLSDHIEIKDLSDLYAKFDIQGPASAELMEKIGISKDLLPSYYKWTKVIINNIPVLLSRTGYTGELGFELYFSANKAVDMWRFLLAFDEVKPVGLGARDTLRLEMGYPLYGHEMDKSTTPIEAGFSSFIDLSEQSKFHYIETLRKKPKKQLIGLLLNGRRACRNGDSVIKNGKVIGVVSSGTFSPSLSKAIALAFVCLEEDIQLGDLLEVDTGRAILKANVVHLPFYKNGSVRAKV